MSSSFITIHPENPQERLIRQVVEILRNQGVIVYPTDSGYALGCMLDNKSGMERICRIRAVDKNHNFTLVCSDISNLSQYASFDNQQFKLLKRYTPGPYTFILRASKEVPRRVMNERRRTIGIRVPDNRICECLISELGEPIMSTSLILPDHEEFLHDPYEINDLLGHAVDAIVDGGYLQEKPTTVVDLMADGYEVTRVGEGDPTPFLK